MNFNSSEKTEINIRKILKYTAVILAILSVTMSSFSNVIYAVIYSNLPKSTIEYNATDNSSVFPESYKAYIKNLKSLHPNWIFKAVYTGLDWNESVRQESYEVNKGVSVVPTSDQYSNWRLAADGVYVDGTKFYTATKTAVAYTMDPRNFLNDSGIFQFEALDFNNETATTQAINKIIAGTTMSDYPTQYKKNGSMVTFDSGLTWPQIIINASKNTGGSGISAVFLASRMKQETSLEILNNGSINGSSSIYPGVYNFFNIGSTSSDGNSVTNGLKYASDKGWTTPQTSINAGAKYIWTDYIQYGQSTVYFQKFDVNNPYGNATMLYGSQYMQNILAPSSEAKITYSAYSNTGLLDSAFVFYIPVYNNMPDAISPHPDSDTNVSVVTGTDIVYFDDEIINGTDVINIRSGPGEEYNIISKVYEQELANAENRTKFTRIQVGTNGWDKIRLANGTEGYVSQTFVRPYNYTHVTGVTFDKSTTTLKTGENSTLTANIAPTNAYIKNITWNSSNPSIANVDSSGKVTGVSIGETNITATTLDGSKVTTCKVTVTAADISVDTNNIVTKVALETNAISIKNKINTIDSNYTNYTKKVLSSDGTEVTDSTLIGTGTKIQVLNGATLVKEYTVVIYGDVNGDGKASASDYVLIKNHIMATRVLNNIEKMGADFNIDGKISSSDYVLIKNYIMSK